MYYSLVILISIDIGPGRADGQYQQAYQESQQHRYM
jgi:hypothetical protein